MDSTRRIEYYDAVKGFAMLTIMWGHFGNFEPFLSFGETFFRTWTSSFKLAVFYVVAGILLHYSHKIERLDFEGYGQKLFRSLMKPFIYFNLMLLVFYAVFLPLHGDGHVVHSVLRMAYQVLNLEGISTLWFLPTLFFGEILFFKLEKTGLRNWKKIVLLLMIIPATILMSRFLMYELEKVGAEHFLLVQAPILTIGRSFVALFFVGLGYYLQKYLLERMNSAVLEFVTAAVCIAFITLTCRKNLSVDLSMLDFGMQPLLFFLNGLVGSIGIIMAFKLINRAVHFRFMSWAGRNSLILMLTHASFRIILIPIAIITMITDVTTMTDYYIYSLIGLAILMVLELPIILGLNKYGKTLIGKR